MQDRFGKGGFFFVLILFGVESGVNFHFAEEIGNGSVGIVFHRVLKRDFIEPFCKNTFVNFHIRKGCARFIIETYMAVGVPSTPFDVLSIEVVVEGEGVDGSRI